MSRHQSSVMPKPSCSTHRASTRRAMMHSEAVAQCVKLASAADPSASVSLHLPRLEEIFAQSADNSPTAMWQAGDQLYRRITGASHVMQHAARALSHEHAEACTRLATHERRLYRSESKLRAAKQHLQTTRRTIFIDTLRARGITEDSETREIPYRLHTFDGEQDEGYSSSSPRADCPVSASNAVAIQGQ